MSAVKRTVKPIKAKAVAEPAAPVETAPTPVETDVVKRQQTGKTVGININPARVRCHLDKLNLNNAINQQIKPIKKQLAALKNAKFVLETGTVHTGKVVKSDNADASGKKTSTVETRPATEEDKAAANTTIADITPIVHDLESKLEALSRERTRFSTEASIALAIVCDEFVQQFGEHAMKRVLAAKKKIIQVEHLHESGVEKLSLYPLIQNLPSFVKTADANLARLRKLQDEELVGNTRIVAEKDFKKKYGVTAPKKKATVPAETAPPATEATEIVDAAPAELEPETHSDDADSKTSFKHYVGLVCKDLMDRDPSYKNTRVSDGIKQYLSDLLSEFIHKLSPRINLTTQCMKNKTVNDVAIMRTIESILIDGHDAVEIIDYVTEQIADPAVVKTELAKRETETKAGHKYKIDFAAIPKVDSLSAVRKIQYPTSGFADLDAKVTEKLELVRAAETA